MDELIDRIIDVATERGVLHEAMECIDEIKRMLDEGKSETWAANRLAFLQEQIEAGVRPRASAVRDETDLYGHPLDDRGLAIVPVTGRGSYTPPPMFVDPDWNKSSIQIWNERHNP